MSLNDVADPFLDSGKLPTKKSDMFLEVGQNGLRLDDRLLTIQLAGTLCLKYLDAAC